MPGGISVFFPAFNDAPSLPGLLARTFQTLSRIATNYEVIVVNDGSSDGTAQVLEELRQTYHPFLRVVTHDVNQGYGAALRSGFAAATKEFIFYTDGDSQYDPAELENLVAKMTPETGLVNGYKIERNDPWHRIAIGWLYNRFARWLFRIRLRDIDCDFRLIRRSSLRPEELRSTGGTICVELVRTLELSGDKVAEVPVHHYARQHGRSQFFRLQSLAITFYQLCAVFFRLVLLPVIERPAPESAVKRPLPSARAVAVVATSVSLLSLLAYGWVFRLPFISDDYVQIELARQYGGFSGWSALTHDALYRCRATSLVLTYWIDRAFGLDPLPYNLTSFLLHIVNALLVFCLGFWNRVGWRLSTLAALIFAIGQRKSEAVAWFAAVPELLVFLFVMAGFLCFVHWLQSNSTRALAGSFVLFLGALLSKESAVALVPLLALAVASERQWKRLWMLAPFAAVAGVYFLMALSARETHLHFNDGTFSLSAPFVRVLIRSAFGLLWVWGILVLPVLTTSEARSYRPLLLLAAGWILVTLFPYSFLTYMREVPSRHTYLASVGRSLIIGAAFLTLTRSAWARQRPWVAPLVAATLLCHQCLYLWTVKQRQYANRAQPTEQLIRAGGEGEGPIYAKCFPYSPYIAEYALKLTSTSRSVMVVGPEAAKHPSAIDFCNEDADGVHY